MTNLRPEWIYISFTVWIQRLAASTCPRRCPASAATAAMKSIALPRYAELHCVSNFSFLKGASHPEELVIRATELGYAALAITDECSLAGVVRAHAEAKRSQRPEAVDRQQLRARLTGSQLVADRVEPQRLRQPVGTDHARPHAQREGQLSSSPRADFDGQPAIARRHPHIRPAASIISRGLPDCVALWIPPRRRERRSDC